jgi:hypothetical protein
MVSVPRTDLYLHQMIIPANDVHKIAKNEYEKWVWVTHWTWHKRHFPCVGAVQATGRNNLWIKTSFFGLEWGHYLASESSLPEEFQPVYEMFQNIILKTFSLVIFERIKNKDFEVSK